MEGLGRGKRLGWVLWQRCGRMLARMEPRSADWAELRDTQQVVWSISYNVELRPVKASLSPYLSSSSCNVCYEGSGPVRWYLWRVTTAARARDDATNQNIDEPRSILMGDADCAGFIWLTPRLHRNHRRSVMVICDARSTSMTLRDYNHWKVSGSFRYLLHAS